MPYTKTNRLTKYILLAYLGIFPFGQIPALLITFVFHTPFSIHPSDLLIMLFVLVSFLVTPDLFKSFQYSSVCKACVIFIFSFLFGAVLLSQFNVSAFLYLIRACGYLSFGYILWKERPLTRKELTHFLVINALTISAIGLAQYVFLPDTRFLKAFGWDDHYYRLLSTFLDPAYTAILLVCSLLFLAFSWKPQNLPVKIGTLLLVTTSLLLTYSRAGFVALVVGLFMYSFKSRNMRWQHMLFVVVFALSILFLPRAMGGEGVHLERTFSLFLKIQNSQETFALALHSPVFGVGYNNLCLARSLEVGKPLSLYSHSCSGADNSFIFILATMGVVGLLFILWQLMRFLRLHNTPLMFAVAGALFFHTQFTNTLFYPWVFVWVLLYSLTEGVKEYR